MEHLVSAASMVSSSLVFPVLAATPAEPPAKRPYNRRPKVDVDPRPKRKYQRRVVGPPGFLIKLRAMLNDASLYDIVRWNDDGNGVVVMDKEAFVKVVYPKYGFKTEQFHTFTRQLNLYQFARVSSNKDSIEFANECFLRNDPFAEQKIHRKDQTGKPKTADGDEEDTEAAQLPGTPPLPRTPTLASADVPAVCIPPATLPCIPAVAALPPPVKTRVQKAAAVLPKKLPAAAWRALQAKRPLEVDAYSGGFGGYGEYGGDVYGERSAPVKRHLSRMDAAEQAVRMLRHDLEALRTDMQEQMNQLHALVRSCLASATADNGCILQAPEYTADEYAPEEYAPEYMQPAADVDTWGPEGVPDFSIPFEQHLLATEDTQFI